ncbi:MAG: MFS transporter [Dehalococcoidia bacterium]
MAGAAAVAGVFDEAASRRNVQRFYIYRFLSNFQFFIPIFILYMIEVRGLTLAQIALLETIFSVTALTAEMPTGAVADRFGRRISIALSASVVSVAILAYGLAPSFGFLAMAYFIWAIARTFESGADYAFLYDSLASVGKEDEFPRTIGRAQAVLLSAAVFASVIGAPLAALTSLQTAVMLGSIFTLLSALVALTFREPPRRRGEEHLPYVQTMVQAARLVATNPRLRSTAALFAIFLGLGFTVYAFMQALLRQEGVAVEFFPFFTVPPQLIAIVGSLVVYRVVARLNERNFFYLAGFGITISLILIGVIPSLFAFALFPVFRFCTSMFNPISQHYINQQTPQRIRATVLSVTSMAEGLMLAIIGPAIGLMADSTSIRTAYVVVGAAVGLSGTVALWAWTKADRGPDTRPRLAPAVVAEPPRTS